MQPGLPSATDRRPQARSARAATAQNPLRRADLDDFMACCKPGRPHEEHEESERFKAYGYEEIVGRDKANLDLTWLRDESLEDLENLPSPDVLAREIVEDLTAALAEFETVATALEEQLGTAEVDEDALTADWQPRRSACPAAPGLSPSVRQ